MSIQKSATRILILAKSKLITFYIMIEDKPLVKIIQKYIPIFLAFLLIVYICVSLYNSNINIFTKDLIAPLIIFFTKSFLIAPYFLLSSSIRFHLIKSLLGYNTSFYKSLKSVLISSSLDAFTPAKINDFARVKNESKSKIVILSVVLERIIDFSILVSIFLFTSTSTLIIRKIIFPVFIILLLIIGLTKYKFLYLKKILKILSCIQLTYYHWFIAYQIFKSSFSVFIKASQITNHAYYINFIQFPKFVFMTIISTLPISAGGIGIREASSITIFSEIDSSIVLTSTICYGIAVSGSLTFIGLAYVNINKFILENKSGRTS
ncbi:hypothetical protein CL656_07150 [bacterium]|nr:hypothetical protein [bacterium]|tara:strand:- start:361 stop:1323 length:963 start_codon:yes stop_codon:yes gene_type:complete